MSFELTLSLPPHHAQSDTLMVYSSRSQTIITVDDNREPECCECHLASEASLPSRLNSIIIFVMTNQHVHKSLTCSLL